MGCVALPRETAVGIAAVATPCPSTSLGTSLELVEAACPSQKVAATPRIGIYEMASNIKADFICTIKPLVILWKAEAFDI